MADATPEEAAEVKAWYESLGERERGIADAYAQARAEEIERLREWKASALPLLNQYDDIAERVGGLLGSSKVENLAKYVNREQAREQAAWEAAINVVRATLGPRDARKMGWSLRNSPPYREEPMPNPTPKAVAKARETWNANKFSSTPQVMLDAFARALDAYARAREQAVWEAAAPYLSHHDTCGYWVHPWADAHCSCGLAALRAAAQGGTHG